MDKENLEKYVSELESKNKEYEKVIEGLKKEIRFMQDRNKPSELYVGDGATPMTVAELVVRDAMDAEWIRTVVYYLNCYLNEPSFGEEDNANENIN